MAFITSPSVSVLNGNKTVSVSGNVDLSSVDEGWAVQIGTNKLVEASSGTAPNSSGISTLTLYESWQNGNVTAATMEIIPNSGYQIALAKRIKSIADRTVDVMQLQHDYASQLGQVTATDPETNEQHTYNTLRQNQQSLDNALDNHAQSINELLANKTVDGGDTTPGALLAVGATVKQLDLTNSNIEYVPDVNPTIDLDFEHQIYKSYEEELGLVQKALADILANTRITDKTALTATGKIKKFGANVSTLEYREGKCAGLSANKSFTALNTYSNDLTNWTADVNSTLTENAAIGDLRSFSLVNAGNNNGGILTKSITLMSGNTYYTTFVIDKSANESSFIGVVHRGFSESGWRSGFIDLDARTVSFNVTLHRFIETNYFYIVTISQFCDNDGGVGQISFNARNSDGTSNNELSIGLCGASITTDPDAGFAITGPSAAVVAGDNLLYAFDEEFNSDDFTIVVRISDLSTTAPVVNGESIIALDSTTTSAAIRIRHLQDGGGMTDLYILDNSGAVTLDGDGIKMSLIIDKGGCFGVKRKNGVVTYFWRGGSYASGALQNVEVNRFRVSNNPKSLKVYKRLRVFPVALSDAECQLLVRG